MCIVDLINLLHGLMCVFWVIYIIYIISTGKLAIDLLYLFFVSYNFFFFLISLPCALSAKLRALKN